ncbi:putative membrane protein [Synechococcus sp. BIOS-U3-1]|nr:putative membrane protein [Synechococcus sp. BIOS-U3-1]
MSEKKRDWSFYWWLAFLVMAFVSMVKEGVIIPNAYAAIIFAFGAGWSAANLKNKR